MLEVSKSRHIADAQERPASGADSVRRLQIVLVFQGGGALGAYQAGVYQALHKAGIEPDWIIGTSIGAINASLIAGNEPENRLDRLEEFWHRMKRKEFWGLTNWPGLADTASYWSTLLAGIPGFFKPNPLALLGAHYPLGRDSAGFYSTAPLAKTLTELVDFALIARCTPRLTVGAAHVRTSEMRYFDSRETAITVEHVMASGALPPAFPAVRIDGEPCTSCNCLRLAWTMKTTLKTSISARAGFACAGRRVMPTPGARCSGRRGTTRAIRSKASSCTRRALTSRPRRNDGLRTLGASPRALGPTPRSLRTDLGAFLGASPALATHGLDEGVEIIAAIVIRDLVPRLDILDRTDLDHVFHEIGFGIRSAGMIDVARAVPAVGAVDGPARVDLEHVAGIELVGGFAANLPAAVANDELPLLDRDTGEETQPSFGSADPKVTRR